MKNAGLVALKMGVSVERIIDAIKSNHWRGGFVDGTWYVEDGEAEKGLPETASTIVSCSKKELEKALAWKGKTIREATLALEFPDGALVRNVSDKGGLPRFVWDKIQALPDIPLPKVESKNHVSNAEYEYQRSWMLDTKVIRDYCEENKVSPGALAHLIDVSKPTVEKALSDGNNYFIAETTNKFIDFFGDKIVVGDHNYKQTNVSLMVGNPKKQAIEPSGSEEDFDPVDLFIKTLRKMISSGSVVLRDKEDSRTNGNYIGNYDDTYYYLLPKDAYSIITVQIAVDGVSFPLRENALWKEMEKRGILVGSVRDATGKWRRDCQVRIAGKTFWRIRLIRRFVDEDEVINTKETALENPYEVMDSLKKEISELQKTISMLIKSLDSIKSDVITKESLMSDDMRKYLGNIAFNASRCGCKEAWKDL